MKQNDVVMGMPVTIELADEKARAEDIQAVMNYFDYVDGVFSTYKEGSEIMRINRGEIASEDYSKDMKEVFKLAEDTCRQTNGYFNIKNTKGLFDPSGIVKGWAIHRAAKLLHERDLKNFFVDIGGDIEVCGKNKEGKNWRIGIQNPFSKSTDIIKIVELRDCGIATSGTYLRGQHIYNPLNRVQIFDDIVSLTVIGPNVYEADRFATAAFAMGKSGLYFIEALPSFEGYIIDNAGKATMTSGFEQYVTNN